MDTNVFKTAKNLFDNACLTATTMLTTICEKHPNQYLDIVNFDFNERWLLEVNVDGKFNINYYLPYSLESVSANAITIFKIIHTLCDADKTASSSLFTFHDKNEYKNYYPLVTLGDNHEIISKQFIHTDRYKICVQDSNEWDDIKEKIFNKIKKDFSRKENIYSRIDAEFYRGKYTFKQPIWVTYFDNNSQRFVKERLKHITITYTEYKGTSHIYIPSIDFELSCGECAYYRMVKSTLIDLIENI